MEVNGAADFARVDITRKATAQVSRTLHQLQLHLPAQWEGRWQAQGPPRERAK